MADKHCGIEPYLLLAAAFLRRSAQRFFIISEIRFLPAALRCRTFGSLPIWRVVVRLPTPSDETPSSAEIALLMRVRSSFN